MGGKDPSGIVSMPQRRSMSSLQSTARSLTMTTVVTMVIADLKVVPIDEVFVWPPDVANGVGSLHIGSVLHSLGLVAQITVEKV